MRKPMLMVGLVLVVFACSEPLGEMLTDGGQMMMDAGNGMMPDAGAQPGTEGTFAGYSSAVVGLSSGPFAVYAACQADYGASSRICTEAEVLGTLNLPGTPPSGDGDLIGDGAWTVETLASAPNCFAGATSGNYLTPTGRWGSGSCGAARVLACCTVN